MLALVGWVASCSRRIVAADRLGLEILLDPEHAELAAVARAAIAAERSPEIVRRSIEPHLPCSHPLRHGRCARRVGGHHESRQTVLRVVGDPNGILLVVVRKDHEHGAEDLFLRDHHLAPHVGEDRGPDVIAAGESFWAPRPAGYQRGPFIDPGLDVALNAIELRAADEWSHRRTVGQRVADDHFPRGLLGKAYDLCVELAW